MADPIISRRLAFEHAIDGLAKQAADAGMLIEVGFLGFVKHQMRPEVSPAEIAKARIIFFLGAQHTFRAITQMLDPDQEPTDADMERMNKLHKELEKFETYWARLDVRGHG